MPHHLRYQSTAWATHHVVSRMIQGYAFLKPTEEITAIARGVLCYSLEQHKDTIKIHHHAFRSNHFHLLISAEQTKDLASFMCHFKGNLARELARVHDWHGTLWQGRYSSEEVLDWEGYVEVFKYITQNSVKEGLVDHPSEWASLHGYHQITGSRSLRGEWLNRTSLYYARARANASGEVVNVRDFVTTHLAELVHPPMWSEPEEEYWVKAKQLCDDAIEEAQSRRDRPAMGMVRVLAQDVYRSRFTKRGTRPLCRTKCVERMKAFKALYFKFKARFQEASAALREAIAQGIENAPVCFPKEGVPLFGGYGFRSADSAINESAT